MLPQFVLYCYKLSLVLKRQFVVQEGGFINIQCLKDYKIWILMHSSPASLHPIHTLPHYATNKNNQRWSSWAFHWDFLGSG